MSVQEIPEQVDFLVVGSGPVGAAFARRVHDNDPAATILMTELGPKLTGGAWPHEENVRSGVRRSNACPRPVDSEHVRFIPDAERNSAFKVSEDLLAVTEEAFAETPVSKAIVERLSALFAPRCSQGRGVGPMPLSAARHPCGRLELYGPDRVLGSLAGAGDHDADGRFRLVSETICRRLLFDGDRLAGVAVEQLPTGRQFFVGARAVAVAADALRTPQLLWASGIRPDALGHYLNDHAKTVSAVKVLDAPDFGAPVWGTKEFSGDYHEFEIARLRIPFADPGNPQHGEVVLIDTSPAHGDDGALLMGLTLFGAKEVRCEDRIEFSTSEADPYGMPKMNIHYELTERDRAGIAKAFGDHESIAAEFGDFLPGREPALCPVGSSNHHQGTVRMGAVDDGTSVCDVNSRVWGFQNLYVGGNGVIPTSTACNPTLTSVALAVRSADAICEQLARDRR